MEVVHAEQLCYNETQLKHRGSGIAFKDLFKGDDSDPTNNYYFMLGRQRSFYSPVHKHNFDQFRFPILGNISILPDLEVRQGELCYHPEGVQYGPQDDGDEEREILVLQFGGASGQGFLSHAQLRDSQEQLKEQGRFENGKFFRRVIGSENGTAPKEEEPIDAFQALWEHKMGRRLVYPQGRYDRVVKMMPGAYKWMAVKGGTGAWKKTLGVFSERETRVEIIKVESGSFTTSAEQALELVYVLSGRGSVDGVDIAGQSAVRIPPGTAVTWKSDRSVEFLRFMLPTLTPTNE